MYPVILLLFRLSFPLLSTFFILNGNLTLLAYYNLYKEPKICIHFSIHPSIYPRIHSSINHLSTDPFINPTIYPQIHSSINHQSIHRPIQQSNHLSTDPFINPIIYLQIHSSINHLSNFPPVYLFYYSGILMCSQNKVIRKFTIFGKQS